MLAVVIDYGAGNLHSAAKAFARAAHATGHEVRITREASALREADHIILPGVGAFRDCMDGVNAVPGLREALETEVREKRKPFLGICVGMQLLAERGLEHGTHAGLGWIAGEVRPMEAETLKIPHMGWNELQIGRAHPLLNQISSGDHAYFVHSYHMVCADAAAVVAQVDYGGPRVAIVQEGNIVGTQFHPEKSGATGLQLIENFLSWDGR